LIKFPCEVILYWILLEDLKSQFQFHYFWLLCAFFSLFLPGSVLECCTTLRICLFLPGCPFSSHISSFSVSYDPFYSCDVTVNFFFFIYNFIDLCPLPFFLISLPKGSSALFMFSKNQLWILSIFAVVWRFFCTACFWDWNQNWLFPVLWPLLNFPNLLAYWMKHFDSISF